MEELKGQKIIVEGIIEEKDCSDNREKNNRN